MRVRKIELREGTEFLIGRSRYRFCAPTSEFNTSLTSMSQKLEKGNLLEQTLDKNLTGFNSNFPSIEVADYSLGAGEEATNKVFLIDDTYWLGREVSCAFRSVNDIFLAPKHARIFKASNRWFVETLPVPNGMWLRTSRMVVENSASFQIGEQRLRLVCRWTSDIE
jgi:hypothetical protein